MQAFELVMKTSGVPRAEHLAILHAQCAIEALNIFPTSEAKDALVRLTEIVLTRKS